MKKVTKHIKSNQTIKVDSPSLRLLEYVRDLQQKKAAKKKQLVSGR